MTMATVTEIWPAMDDMPEWAQKVLPKGQLFHEAFKRIDFYNEALSDISALAEGYDGFESPEDLRSLIDDMANVAMKARNQEPWTTRIKQN